MAEERGSDGKDDFELGEEEYDDNGEHEVDLQNKTHPQQSWAAVNEVYNVGNDRQQDSDGSWEESDLDSLCNDDVVHNRRGRSKNEFNPQSRFENFKFKIGMEFPTMTHMRNVLREVFIQNDRDFKYVFNDSQRVRA